ncbi:hypothetical protein FH972_015656 [Carpinus fangiana]|uniref:Uncharacterized protein n=1 Tax=Carpinus fangiana TaxID=176857 RepID=A0A5N6RH15_9ROSI|nr:hypothetical protein FH972_015656 [Carpinus fangiana]
MDVARQLIQLSGESDDHHHNDDDNNNTSCAEGKVEQSKVDDATDASSGVTLASSSSPLDGHPVSEMCTHRQLLVPPRHPAPRTWRQSAKAACCRSGSSWKGPAHLRFARTES